jgi:hypothetical protein
VQEEHERDDQAQQAGHLPHGAAEGEHAGEAEREHAEHVGEAFDPDHGDRAVERDLAGLLHQPVLPDLAEFAGREDHREPAGERARFRR